MLVSPVMRLKNNFKLCQFRRERQQSYILVRASWMTVASAALTGSFSGACSALLIASTNNAISNNKGRALMGLSFLQMKLSQPQEVLKSWQAALAAYTRYLEIVPGDEQVYSLRDELKERLDRLGNGMW